MFRPTRPSSGALKFGGNCCAFRATAIRVLVFTVFLHEVNAVSRSMPLVLCFFGMPVVYLVCSVEVKQTTVNKTKNNF
jgi:hypothetical protein